MHGRSPKKPSARRRQRQRQRQRHAPSAAAGAPSQEEEERAPSDLQEGVDQEILSAGSTLPQESRQEVTSKYLFYK